MMIITHGVVTGHPKENARKMSSGCQNTAGLAVAFALKVQCQSKCVNRTLWCKASLSPLCHPYFSSFCILIKVNQLFSYFLFSLYIYVASMPYSGFSLIKCRPMAKKLANSIS